MSGIFISYRRQDSQDFTGRIYDQLAQALGENNVFRDIDDIPIGQDFRAVLDRETGQCDILLVIIGSKWVSIQDQAGNRRLDDPNDFVRLEVESGLKRPDRLVIPVLINNTPMPQASELPESLQSLAYRNAAIVRQDPDFHHDMEKLIRQIKASRLPGISPLKKYLPIGVGLLLVFVISIAAFSWFSKPVPPVIKDIVTDTPVSTLPGPLTDTPQAPAGVTVSPLPDALVAGTRFTAQYGFSVYESASQDSKIVARVDAAAAGAILGQNEDPKWTQVQLDNGKTGWVLSEDLLQSSKLATPGSPRVQATIALGQGFGLRTDEWQVFFTDPSIPVDAENKSGLDLRIAEALSHAKTIDMAIFEMSNQAVTQALLDALKRGAKIRIVTDDENGLGANNTTLTQLQAADIPIVTDNRSGLMHDKFIIIDGKLVWTGSYNLTETSTFKQNNNALVLTSPDVVATFQEQFNKMFEQKLFGPTTPKTSNNIFEMNSIQMEVYFSPQDSVQERYLGVVRSAKKSIRMMAFTFTDTELSRILADKFKAGVPVQILAESTGANAPTNQSKALFCQRLTVQFDGNPNFMHHKVLVIDDQIVITGSLNFTNSALEKNNENIVIINDPWLAKAYNDEFDRLWVISKVPDKAKFCP
jgi:phosphatidylserine/phosphatidylglycerophosphate/cardiolipin synthase-like enzyme